MDYGFSFCTNILGCSEAYLEPYQKPEKELFAKKLFYFRFLTELSIRHFCWQIALKNCIFKSFGNAVGLLILKE